MFEESGVGAEEVASSNDYELCFVDTGTGGVSWNQDHNRNVILTISLSGPSGRWVLKFLPTFDPKQRHGGRGGGGHHRDHQVRDTSGRRQQSLSDQEREC